MYLADIYTLPPSLAGIPALATPAGFTNVGHNILEFDRGQHTYVGIDTLGLSSVATGAVLRELGPGFASGHLKPFPIKPSAIYPLGQAKVAFIAVAGSSRDRVILRPSA